MKVSPQELARLVRSRIRAARLERPDPIAKARRLRKLLGGEPTGTDLQRIVWLAILAAMLGWVLARSAR